MDYKIIYIITAAAVALLLAAFFYLYRAKKSKTIYLLFGLRTVSIFLIILLLFNLKITKRIINNQKPNLFVLVDDSKSIILSREKDKATSAFNDIKNNTDLNKKFNLQFYSFSNDVKEFDSLKFKDGKTNIQQSLHTIKSLSDNQKAPLVLITDGNQTVGQSYEYFKSNLSVFPVIIGDTAIFQDVYISQLNSNKYAYLKHKFPIEVFLGYKGKKESIPVNFTIKEGGKIIYSQKITIGKNNNSKRLTFHLPANKTGLHHYKASISTLKGEKNKVNNNFYFAVDVISENSKILLISDIIHPDIGMLKKAIESNEQRKLIIKKPTDNIDINQYKSIILYQPKANFRVIINQLLSKKKNLFFVTGLHTDWNELNGFQPFFKREFVEKKEDYNAVFNSGFSTFLIEDIGFEKYPPVQDKFGEVSFNVPYQTLLFQQINSFVTEQPLMATFATDKQRFITFFGENMWRWRMYEGKNKHHFKDFDTFINKSMQYLASQNKGDYLEISYKNKYFSNEVVLIKAQTFDANYQFNPNKKMWIQINGDEKKITYPLALEANNYQVKLSELKPGRYSFTIYDDEKSLKKNGSFTVLDFEIEQQNLNGNIKGLRLLAQNNSGTVFFPNQISDLVKKINKSSDFKTIQKEIIQKKPLIDWKVLLGFIALLLSIEWFIRKYKGYT
jgi:hypothetical protein